MNQPMQIIATALLICACASATHANSTKPDWTSVMQNAVVAYAGKTNGAKSTLLSDAQIAAGLKEALGVGTGNVVTRLSKTGGFALDPKIRIPLPSQLQRVDAALKMVGKNDLTNDLETRMNRAAELATPKAKQLFMRAITEMTFADARNILLGDKQDAATQFLRRTMGTQLARDIQPIVKTTLADAGALKALDTATAHYAALPMVGQFTSNTKNNLNGYVADKAIDGIFYYVAKEEVAIRKDPAKRTTHLLKQVFAAR